MLEEKMRMIVNETIGGVYIIDEEAKLMLINGRGNKKDAEQIIKGLRYALGNGVVYFANGKKGLHELLKWRKSDYYYLPNQNGCPY